MRQTQGEKPKERKGQERMDFFFFFGGGGGSGRRGTAETAKRKIDKHGDEIEKITNIAEEIPE